MLRTIFLLRTPLRSLHHSLHSIPPSPLSPPTLSRTRSFIGNPVGPPPPAAPAVLHRPFSSRRKKGGEDREEDDGDGLFLINRDPDKPPRLLAVQPRLRPDSLLQSKLSEALNLANSLEEQRDGLYAEEFGERDPPPHLVVQNPAARSVRAHADTYFGPGTVDSVKCHIKGLESEEELDAVFVNTILSGIQQRNLERAWGKPVLDRVALIIEIFNAHAQTKEAKLQSELAALMYKRTRLVRLRGPGGRLTFGASGEAEVVSARGRGSGGRGFISGAGETELQLQRRRIQERRSHLLTQIEEVRRTRALQRYARKRHGGSHGQGLATVAIVGYTNAGKSTLVSALSQSDLYSDARLFATVDPRLRSVILPSGRKALLSDTVGFISDLPVQLVEAFHATLEEVVEADLLVHVLDSSVKNLVEQRSTVLQVLQQIGVSEEKIQNMIEVWNKIDLLEGETGADKILDQDDDFDEGEDEEVGKFSGDEEMVSELSSEEPEKEDDLETGDTLDQGEDLNEDKKEDYGSFSGEEEDMTCGEPMDEDDLVSGQSHSLEERLADFDVPQDEAFKQCQHEDAQHVKTSAVLGVGLQELLYLIDEKLSAQESTEKRTFESFDRKWRPLYARDGEKVAEQ